MQLQPNRIFADAAFLKAQETSRQVATLSMTPQALSDLQRRLRSAGMVRETGFALSKGQRGPAARYRGADILLDPQLRHCFVAQHTDGTTHEFPLDRHSRK